MAKLLIPAGSITGDPIGCTRYMVIDTEDHTTAVKETRLCYPVATEWRYEPITCSHIKVPI